ncbi:MAG: MvaI/BcnI family restriction endonuclease [Candidatus Zixiibacteriota bacterium]
MHADTKKLKKEYFHYNEAYIYKNPTPERFLKLFEASKIAIDIRMHLKVSGSVRNHGTGFRIFEENIIDLYDEKIKLL